jgi:hypothetical protein
MLRSAASPTGSGRNSGSAEGPGQGERNTHSTSIALSLEPCRVTPGPAWFLHNSAGFRRLRAAPVLARACGPRPTRWVSSARRRGRQCRRARGHHKRRRRRAQPHSIAHINMPATPEKIWRAIHSAQADGPVCFPSAFKIKCPVQPNLALIKLASSASTSVAGRPSSSIGATIWWKWFGTRQSAQISAAARRACRVALQTRNIAKFSELSTAMLKSLSSKRELPTSINARKLPRAPFCFSNPA